VSPIITSILSFFFSAFAFVVMHSRLFTELAVNERAGFPALDFPMEFFLRFER